MPVAAHSAFFSPSLCAQTPDSGLNERGGGERCRFWFFRHGQKALRTGLCTAHLQKQSHLLVQPAPSPFSHTPPPPHHLSLYSPYCPLACFPQCYKLRTTQTSRPNAPPWMPSKLHFFLFFFLGSQKAAFIDNAGHTVRLPHLLASRKAQDTSPSQAQKTPVLFGAYFYSTTADCFINVGLLVKYKNNRY